MVSHWSSETTQEPIRKDMNVLNATLKSQDQNEHVRVQASNKFQ